MQNQFLHTPIHDLRDVEFDFRRAGDFVNPPELLRLIASAAKRAADFSSVRLVSIRNPARRAMHEESCLSWRG